MAFSFTLTDTIPAAPQRIYHVCPSSRGQTKMTGSTARRSAMKHYFGGADT